MRRIFWPLCRFCNPRGSPDIASQNRVSTFGTDNIISPNINIEQGNFRSRRCLTFACLIYLLLAFVVTFFWMCSYDACHGMLLWITCTYIIHFSIEPVNPNNLDLSSLI
jgi:hypothetical protein